MKRVQGFAFVLLLAVAATRGALAAPSVRSEAAIESQCRPYYHDACSEAMGRWLPQFGYSNDWWNRATHVDRRDSFVYEREGLRGSLELGGDGTPHDGLRFAYGWAGPTKGRAVYDYTHHIAFFGQGCCSWGDVIAAVQTTPPPKQLPSRNLLGLSTMRGIRLGQTPSEVMQIYGRSDLLPVPGHPQLRVLAYTTWPPKRLVTTVHSPCGQFENFFFRNNRVVMIQLGNGC